MSKRPRKKKTTGESYYHRSAKAILAAHFLNKGYEVAYEFPIVSLGKHDAAANPWHLHRKEFVYPINDDADMKPFLIDDGIHPEPARQWLIDQGMTPAVIYDVAIFKDGKLKFAYEVRYKHGCDAKKRAIITRVRGGSGAKYKIYEISARWLLGQIKLPKKLKVLREL